MRPLEIKQIQNQLFQELRDVVRSSNQSLGGINTAQASDQLEREALYKIQFIFGSTLQAALKLLDASEIYNLNPQPGESHLLNGQNLYRVQIKNDREVNYILTARDSSFCFCKIFQQLIQENADALPCKHILACIIAECYENVVKQEYITTEQFLALSFKLL